MTHERIYQQSREESEKKQKKEIRNKKLNEEQEKKKSPGIAQTDSSLHHKHAKYEKRDEKADGKKRMQTAE